MIDNAFLMDEIRRLPEKSVLEMMSLLVNNYKSIRSLNDIDGFPGSFKDVSHLEETKEEIASLNISRYSKYHMLAFNAKLSLIGKLELVFSENKLVQSGLQFIFDNKHFHSFLDAFHTCKDFMEHDFLIDQAGPLLASGPFVNNHFGFFDIPLGTPKDIVDFLKGIFNLSESQQKKATLEFFMRKLASGENLAIDDLRLHNTIQGYTTLVSLPHNQVSSLNIRIVEMEWCNAVYR